MTSKTDLDKYYTPPAIAQKALERANLASLPIVCADTACGSGNLLSAAEDVLNTKYSLGIDRDPTAIKNLRIKKPNWHLYVGDSLKYHQAYKVHALDASHGMDLLVLNPPFSLGSKKHVSVQYAGQHMKCSVAMAHLLRGIDLYKPSLGVIAVVPESLLYSDTDQNARDLLSQDFSTSELLQLNVHTFKGAQVNSSFVQLTPKNKSSKVVPPNDSIQHQAIYAQIVRGGLQMHAFDRMKTGTPVIHSTSLVPIAAHGISVVKDKTTTKAKGRVSGWMILAPRVGLPKNIALQAFFSKTELQLSDCVIGVLLPTESDAIATQKRIHANWTSFVSLYRGTGARYITITRLTSWLKTIGVYSQS